MKKATKGMKIKIAVAVLLVGFALIRLAQLLYFAEGKILSDKVLPYAALLIISYFWVYNINGFWKSIRTC